MNIEQIQALRRELTEVQEMHVSCGNAGQAPSAIMNTNARITRLTEILIAVLWELESSQ